MQIKHIMTRHFNKLVIAILLCLLTSFVRAQTPVYKQLMSFYDGLPAHRASIVSFYVYHHAHLNNLNPHLLAAILIQESALRLDAQNYASNDFGIGQINVRTARHFCPDIKRLLTDYNYSIGCAAAVLGDFKKRYAHREKTWWTRYNSSHIIYRKRYKKMVVRHLEKNYER